MAGREELAWPTPPQGIRSLGQFDDASLLNLLEILQTNQNDDWFKIVHPPENPGPIQDQIPGYDHQAELAAVPDKPTEGYRQQAADYVQASIEIRERIRPDSLRPLSELPDGISRTTSSSWVYYQTNDQIPDREDDIPQSEASTTKHGKYLFFTPDETGVLEQIVVEQFLERPFSAAKVPTEPNRRNDAVLCLYYGDDRYWPDLRERYQNEPDDHDTYSVASPFDPDSPVIKPRGFKTDEATRRNEYSEKFRKSS